MMKKIAALASLFLNSVMIIQASFPNRKDVIEKQPLYKDVADKVYKYIETHMPGKGSKYFGITFQLIEEKYEVFADDEVLFDCVHVFKDFERFNIGKDINQYKNYDELRNDVDHKLIEVATRKKKVDTANVDTSSVGDSTLIFEDDNTVVYRLNSKQGANAIAGRDTTWCIARVSGMYYDQYTSTN
jgi:hypothetical protein